MPTAPMRQCRSIYRTIIAVVLLGSAGVDVAAADEALRWKLSAGDELAYEIAKSSALAFGEASTQYNLSQTVNVTWRVLEVSEAGVATIEQAVDRIRLELDDPLGDVRYDSDEDDEPGSLAALAATVFSAMTEHNIQFTLAPDGTIEEIRIPKPLLEAVGNASFAKSLDRFASEEGLRDLLIPRLPVFPEEDLQPGHTWGAQVEQPSGTHQVEIRYRYDGQREQDERSLAVVEQTPDVAVGGEDGSLRIKSQDAAGEVLFDRAQGRLISSRWEVQLRAADSDDQVGRLEQEFHMDLIGGPASD